jgi:transcriptional regulator with XRE-family HTH domain
MVDRFHAELPDPELLKTVGSRLRALRKAQGLTLEEVASRAGLDRGTVSRAEHGENPTMLTVLRLLRTYGRLGALSNFIPEAELSPMDLIRQSRSASDG